MPIKLKGINMQTRSYCGTYCDRNMKSETETYVAHLIFMQLPGITCNNQELKAFLTKMNGIIHRHQFSSK